MAEVCDQNVWESGGNVVSLEQKRREYAAKRAEEEQDERDIVTQGLFVTDNSDFIPLQCPDCGDDNIVLLRDAQFVTAECSTCGEPMLEAVVAFLKGED